MILYHGSNVEIDTIDFSKSKVGKDFGVGFYLSAEEQQAQEMADKKTQMFAIYAILSHKLSSAYFYSFLEIEIQTGKIG